MTAPVQNRGMDDLIVSWEGQQDAYIRHSAWRFGIILDTIGCTRRVPATDFVSLFGTVSIGSGVVFIRRPVHQ